MWKIYRFLLQSYYEKKKLPILRFSRTYRDMEIRFPRQIDATYLS